MTYREFAEYVQLGKEPSDKKFDPSTPREELQYTSTYTRTFTGGQFIRVTPSVTTKFGDYFGLEDGFGKLQAINSKVRKGISIIGANPFLNNYHGTQTNRIKLQYNTEKYYIVDSNYNEIGSYLDLSNNDKALVTIQGKVVHKVVKGKGLKIRSDGNGGWIYANHVGINKTQSGINKFIYVDETGNTNDSTPIIDESKTDHHADDLIIEDFKVTITYVIYVASNMTRFLTEYDTCSFKNYWGQELNDSKELPPIMNFPSTYKEAIKLDYDWSFDIHVLNTDNRLIVTGEVTKPIYINRITPNEEGDLNLEEFDLVDLEEYLAKEKDWNSNYIDKLFGYIEDSDKYTMKIGAKTWSAPNIYGSHYGWKGKIERLTPKYYKTADRIFIPRDYIEGFERQIRKLEVKNGIS